MAIPKILIIPDVHGRDFWSTPCARLDDYDKVIFLGDYVDPYGYEGISREMAIDALIGVMRLRKAYPDKVVLLLGNHDCGYAFGTGVSSSRYDAENAAILINLFRRNHSLFQLAYELDVNGRHFVFSHAGILRYWFVEACYSNYAVAVDWLNNSYCEKNEDLGHLLGMVSVYRCGDSSCGSVVWADEDEWKVENRVDYPEKLYHVFGHSQQEVDPIITDWWACLDCRRTFDLHEDGRLYEYGGTEPLQIRTI